MSQKSLWSLIEILNSNYYEKLTQATQKKSWQKGVLSLCKFNLKNSHRGLTFFFDLSIMIKVFI